MTSLKWLGMNWDEGPYFQTKRMELYRSYAQKLLEEEKAYEEEGKMGQNKAVILKMPKDTLKMNDLIHGEVAFDMSLQKDLVLMKSDGTPTYNFACVIDDFDMKITYVIRGDDHISNTPKQLALYQALGITPPAFAHIPLILGVDRSRMSKRHGATSIADYRNMGFLSDALVNYISFLGWSPASGKEILSADEIIKEFSLERVGKTGAAFDIDKLTWMNGEYIRMKSLKEVAQLLPPYLKEKGYTKDTSDEGQLIEVLKLLAPRAKTLEELAESAKIFFQDKVEYNEEAVKSVLVKEGVKMRLSALIEKFSALSNFDLQNIESCVRNLAEELGIKAADLIHPIRVAITGTKIGPSLFETVALLGKDKVITRLKETLDKAK